MKNKKRLCLLMTLVVMGAGVSVYAQEPSDVLDTESTQQQEQQVKDNKDAYEKAQNAINNKDYQSAIVYLTGYISSKPKKYEAYQLRGQSFYALRQYKLALMDFQTAIDLKKDNDKFATGAKVISAVVLGVDKQEQYQNAELGKLYADLMYAQKALNLPAYEISYQNAVKYNSHIYLPQPKKDDIAKINAPQKYGKMLNPQGVDSYVYGSISDIEAENFLEASYKAQYIVTNFPKYYLGYYLLGVALDGLDKENEAISAFETAIKYNPYDFESLASLGLIYFKDAQKTFSSDAQKKSNEYFTSAIKYNSNNHLYYYYIGLNQLQAGNYDSAIANFSKAVKFKTNDYNSAYYKLIAQYLKGNYSEVVEGCTNLLYRHVSNSNSVLYLRALAHNKLNNSAFALADIETIQNNLGDIYNSDVKTVSNKEKTLESYLYYLKAQILSAKGFGVKSDMAKALQNSVISALNKGGNIDAATLQLSAQDVENQYDYLRTTFDKLNVSFEYLNPNYKFITLKPVNIETEQIVDEQDDTSTISLRPAAEPQDILSSGSGSIAEMLASNALITHSEQAIKQDKTAEEKIPLIESSTVVQAAEKVEDVQNNMPVEPSKATEEEIVVLDPDTIMFKAPVQKESESFDIKYQKQELKLATETEYVSVPVEEQSTEEKSAVQESESIIVKAETSQTESIDEENSKILPVAEATIEETIAQVVPADLSSAHESVSQIVPNPQDEVGPQVEPISSVEQVQQVESETTNPIEFEAQIKTDSKIEPVFQAESKPQVEIVQSAEDVQNTTAEQVTEVAKQVIVEHKPKIRQTNMNLKGFGSEIKLLPEIKEGDEVIVFVPEEKSFISEIEQNLKADTVSLNSQKPITDNFAAIKQNIKPETINATEKEPELIDPEEVKIPAKLLAKSKSVPVKEPEPQEDDYGAQINESAPISPESLVLANEPTLKSDNENIEEKKEKVKKEVDLKDFLGDGAAPAKEKNVKVKKEKKLKDFLSEAEDLPSKPELNQEEENELKKFLDEDITNSESEIKKEKRSLFKRRKKVEKIEESVPTVEVEEPQTSDAQIPPVVEETPVNNDVETIEPEQKPKKSWLSFFKRNKKAKITAPEKVEEAIVPDTVEKIREPQPNLDEAEKPVFEYQFDENKFDEILKGEEQKPEKTFKNLGKKSKKVEKEQE